MVNDKAAASKRDRKAGPRTRITGGKTCRIKDLVVVKDPRDSGQTFTALVVGGYTLSGTWHVQLAPPPSERPAQKIPRQSTKAKHVKAAYRPVR